MLGLFGSHEPRPRPRQILPERISIKNVTINNMPVNHFNSDPASGVDRSWVKKWANKMFGFYVSKVEDAEGDRVLVSKENGGMKESRVTVADINNKIPKISSPKPVDNLPTVDEIHGKDGYIMVSDGEGGVKEGFMTQSGQLGRFASKISSPQGNRVLRATSRGQIKESDISISDVALYKDFIENFGNFNPGGFLFLMDRRVSYVTNLVRVVFDAKLKQGKTNKLKKLQVVSTTNGTDYVVVQEYTISSYKNYKIFSVNFNLPLGSLWNLKVIVDGSDDPSELIDFMRVKWYYRELHR